MAVGRIRRSSGGKAESGEVFLIDAIRGTANTFASTKILTMSTNAQTPVSQPTSAVKNTLGKEQVLHDLGRPASDAALRKAASEAGSPKSCGSCSFPSVFLTMDEGWLRGVCSLVLMMSILGNAVVFASHGWRQLESLVLGFPSISLIDVMTGVGPLSGKGPCSYTKGWMSFIKRSDAAPVCHSKPLDSVKNWNDHFFWVDSMAFPLSVYLKKMDLFAFIRHSDPTKVWIGERDLAKREVKLLKMTEGRTVSLDPLATAAYRDSGDSIDKLFNEGDDAGQEHSVKKDDDVLDETIAQDVSDVAVEKAKKKRKRKVAGDASGSTHPPKKLRDDYQSAPLNTSGKSLATLHGLVLDGSGIPSGVTKPLITASVSPTQDVGPTDSVSGSTCELVLPISLVADALVVTVAVTTTVVADVDVILGSKARVESKNLKNVGDSASAGGANAFVASILKLNKPSSSSDSFYASKSLDTKTMHRVYVPRWKVMNDFVLEDVYVCRDLTDRLAPPALFAQLLAMDYDQLYSEFNVEAARQVCLGAKVRMRAEHTLEKKGELEDKYAEQAAFLSERDAEIVHLKSLLSLKEAEAAEAIRLHGQLTTVEAADAAKDNELKDLKEKNFMLEGERDLSRDELHSQVASLESERDGLINQMSLLESAFKLFSARMEATQCLHSPEYCHALGTAIDCAVNKAVNALGAVDFSFLFELKSKKDANIIDLIDSLRLEGPLAENLGAKDLRSSLEQLRLLVHRPKDNVVIGETSLSFSLQVVHSRVQRVKGEIMKRRLSLTDVMAPLAEPLSSRSLIGEASTFAAPTTTEPITTLSITLASSDVIPPLASSNDQALDTKPNDEDPPCRDL
uniref:Transposase (Putative), gypsy type n=1 Tax=Tanacetum cinerariifolium TaxID=118510 RepID=A0A6L2P4R9_TANCI|nr:hypothetical protein [Tanacetum cinerariifolium]